MMTPSPFSKLDPPTGRLGLTQSPHEASATFGVVSRAEPTRKQLNKARCIHWKVTGPDLKLKDDKLERGRLPRVERERLYP